MPRSPCFCTSTRTWVVYCWSHCFVKPGLMLRRRMLLVMQVRLTFLGSHCISSRVCRKERRTHTPQSPVPPMAKVSSVRKINPATRPVRTQNTIHLETANMLLMIYAHARTSGNVSLIQKYVGVFLSSSILWFTQSFADLSYDTMDRIPYWLNALYYATVRSNSLSESTLAHKATVLRESADLLSIYNQTNLAIKGIIAIKAMSVMSDVAKQSTSYSVCA
jgi:hypothetical protein